LPIKGSSGRGFLFTFLYTWNSSSRGGFSLARIISPIFNLGEGIFFYCLDYPLGKAHYWCRVLTKSFLTTFKLPHLVIPGLSQFLYFHWDWELNFPQELWGSGIFWGGAITSSNNLYSRDISIDCLSVYSRIRLKALLIFLPS